MKKKTIATFIILYTFQFLLSACTCNCPPVKTYNSTYTDFILQSWDTSGFTNSEIATTAYKNAFGLSIDLNITDESVASNSLNLNLNNFGFANAYAWSCNCPFDIYLYPDPIVDIEIFVTNTVTSEKTMITESFKSSNYYRDEAVSIKELFHELDRWNHNFRLDLIEFDMIPDSAVFTVSILLDSGKELIQNTSTIEFI